MLIKSFECRGKLYQCLFDENTITHNLGLCLTQEGYMYVRYTSGVNKDKAFARVLLGLVGKEVADHKDRNSLNNQRYNLRKVTYQGNAINRVQPDRNNLPKGVCRKGSKFIARIKLESGLKYLGQFSTPEFAAKAVAKYWSETE